ncbi:hypothetical protein MINTMi27_15740 [Mycobacterium intracellulare]|uniref:endonuclease domain-containing protein n=1 Tax=Mycobacterium intracellulare TaxID=1767 RepID=UPI0019292A7A|nr:hypothetical protein MINTMi27_15740 [Mycobacterium intracellulare]
MRSGRQLPDAATLKKYNITATDYLAMLERQGGACALCRMSPNDRVLVIDHDHKCCDRQGSCGKCVRGLLCYRCNNGLGFVEKSPSEWVSNVASYLGLSIAYNSATVSMLN